MSHCLSTKSVTISGSHNRRSFGWKRLRFGIEVSTDHTKVWTDVADTLRIIRVTINFGPHSFNGQLDRWKP